MLKKEEIYIYVCAFKMPLMQEGLFFSWLVSTMYQQIINWMNISSRSIRNTKRWFSTRTHSKFRGKLFLSVSDGFILHFFLIIYLVFNFNALVFVEKIQKALWLLIKVRFSLLTVYCICSRGWFFPQRCHDGMACICVISTVSFNGHVSQG